MHIILNQTISPVNGVTANHSRRFHSNHLAEQNIQNNSSYIKASYLQASLEQVANFYKSGPDEISLDHIQNKLKAMPEQSTSPIIVNKDGHGQ